MNHKQNGVEIYECWDSVVAPEYENGFLMLIPRRLVQELAWSRHMVGSNAEGLHVACIRALEIAEDFERRNPLLEG